MGKKYVKGFKEPLMDYQVSSEGASEEKCKDIHKTIHQDEALKCKQKSEVSNSVTSGKHEGRRRDSMQGRISSGIGAQ